MATTSCVWSSWVDISDSTTCGTTNTMHSADSYDSGTSATTVNTVWGHWITDTGSTVVSAGTQDTVWNVWATVDGSEVTHVSVPSRVLSAEEEKTRQEENARWAREAEERRKQAQIKRDEAEDAAKELLLELIGPKELEVYNETGRLFVKGRKYDYIIQRRGFVQRIEKDKITDLCVHLENQTMFPKTDNVIALLMMLKTEEKHILELANSHGSRSKPEELPRFARAA